MAVNKNDKNNVKAQIRAENQEKILAAASKLFAEKGFAGTTVQEIANESGLPKANVLYYYKSKQGVYSVILGQIMDIWNSSFDEATVDDDPAETLAKYIAQKMEWSRIYPEASKIFAIEMINGGHQLSDGMRTGMKSWFDSRVELINQWKAKGKIHNVNAEYLLFQIWSTTQHYADFSSQITLLRDTDEFGKKDYDEASRYLVTSILSGCGLKN